MDLCLGILEIQGLGPAFVLADLVLKTTAVEIPGMELNSLGGITVKLVGSAAAIEFAVARASEVADAMGFSCVPTRLFRYPASLRFLIYCRPRYSAIIQDRTQLLPENLRYRDQRWALGVLETQGFVGVVAGADAMLKAAEVHMIGKEKIGAAYVNVFVWGSLAAVQEAVEAGKKAASSVGKLAGGYVIANPHPQLLLLLPV